MDTNANLRAVLDEIEKGGEKYWKAAVVKEARGDLNRDLADVLSRFYHLCKRLGFDTDYTASHTTLSRHWDYAGL